MKENVIGNDNEKERKKSTNHKHINHNRRARWRDSEIDAFDAQLVNSLLKELLQRRTAVLPVERIGTTQTPRET